MRQTKNAEKLAQSQKGLQKIYENEKCIVSKILTPEASYFYCKGTT